MATCAVCVCEIRGAVFREPLGRDDALVDVCRSCATEPARPQGSVSHPVRKRDRVVTNSRAQQLRDHREDLKRRGLCRNGANHGKATRGGLCDACDLRYRRKRRPAQAEDVRRA